MENYSKFQQSTSSSFYQTNPQKTKYFQPIKSSFAQLSATIQQYKDRSSIMQLQESINTFNKKLRQSEQGILKISSMEELKLLLQKCQGSLIQAKAKCVSAQNQIKHQIQAMINCLEKQLQILKKSWERIREDCNYQLTQDIQQIKTIKKKDQTLICTLMKTTSQKLRDQINMFAQDLKQTRKNRNNSTGKLFGQLEQINFNLTNLMDCQQAKRSDYDQIIYGLLQKTCESAQQALRRRVY